MKRAGSGKMKKSAIQSESNEELAVTRKSFQ